MLIPIPTRLPDMRPIIAGAGAFGAVTIATNMAGRGTDIILGGNWEAEIAGLEEPTAAQIDEINFKRVKQEIFSKDCFFKSQE